MTALHVLAGVMNPDDLYEQLAELGHISADEWRDILASPPDVQERILATRRTAGVRPGPDYWAAVEGVLKVGGTVIGVASGVESAITLVQAMGKL